MRLSLGLYLKETPGSLAANMALGIFLVLPRSSHMPKIMQQLMEHWGLLGGPKVIKSSK